MKLIALFKTVPEGYIGWVEEVPGANTQGAALEEAGAHLREALELVLDANRVLAEEEIAGQSVQRESFTLAAA